MNRIARRCLPLSVLSCWLILPSFVSADPSDLLRQAIEENDKPAKKDEVKTLITRADRLADQKKFNEAIKLYEKAYRLAPSDQANYARLLVAKRAAGVMTAQDREALDLIEQQQASAVEQIFRTTRLHMIQARQALRDGDTDLARAQIDSASAALDGLPRYVDDAPYRRRLESLSRALRRKAGKTGSRNPSENDSTITITRRVDKEDSDAPFTLMDTGEDDPSSDVAHSETGEIIDVDEVLRANRERHAYDRELARALARQRTDTILSNNEAALPLPGMTFPDDWAQRV
ncbi:MAG: tetratricopeptide repeat protein, partial [Phycisphaerae bacterium]